MAGFQAEIKDLRVAGTFAADGSYFGGGELSGQLDARDLVDVVDGLGLEAESAEDICNLLLGFGVTCDECGGDTPGAYCVTLEVNRLVANDTEDPLEVVCEGDCHEECGTIREAACSDETSTDQATCEGAGGTWIAECSQPQLNTESTCSN